MDSLAPKAKFKRDNAWSEFESSGLVSGDIISFIVLTEPGFSTIVHAIRQTQVIFQLERMRNYSIYACAVSIRIMVSFAILSSVDRYNFPPFMILIIAALLINGTITALSVERVLASITPDSWDLAEIFSFAVAYGLYLTLYVRSCSFCFFRLLPVTNPSLYISRSSIALVVIIVQTNFFQRTFGV